MDLAPLCAIIRHVGDRMTAGDISEEYGYSRRLITLACARLGITLPTRAEVNKLFIREMAPHKTLQEMAAALDMGELYVLKLAHEAGVIFKQQEVDKPRRPRRTMEQIRREATILEGKKEVAASLQTSARFKDKYTQGRSPYGIADTNFK